ncbi:MAG: hypothetical protein AAF528_00390 [Cyanobacteria bacterium P01_C01_bin.121]
MDPTTTHPLQPTVDLLDEFNQQDWTSEDDWEGPVEVGLGLKPYVEKLASVSPEQYRHQRWQVSVLSILWPELKSWLQTWELGLSFDAVYQEAKQRVYGHLKQPTPVQTDWLNALLAEEEQKLPRSERVVRQQVIPRLSSLLTNEDYKALSELAARDMAAGVMQYAQQAS